MVVAAPSRIAPRPERVDRDPETGYVIRYNRHPARRNNYKVAEMYDCYRDGMSLAKIAWLYKTTRQAVYDVFRSRGYPLRSKKLRGLTIVDGHRFTLTKGGYLRGTVAGERILLHWYVWEKAHGKVPEGYCIHHIDNDPANNEISNLELVKRTEMTVRFRKLQKADNQHSI